MLNHACDGVCPVCSTFTQGHLDATAASTVVDTLRKLLDAPMGMPL